jgi:hypothetical protein
MGTLSALFESTTAEIATSRVAASDDSAAAASTGAVSELFAMPSPMSAARFRSRSSPSAARRKAASDVAFGKFESASTAATRTWPAASSRHAASASVALSTPCRPRACAA